MNCNKYFMFFMKYLLIKMISGLGRHPLVFEMHPSQWCILNVAPIGTHPSTTSIAGSRGPHATMR